MFCEWLDAMNELNPKEYKAMMTAIYHCQMQGAEPPEFKGKARIIAAMVFPCIRRRVAQACGGKKGVELRRRKLSENPIINDILQKRADEKAEK